MTTGESSNSWSRVDAGGVVPHGGGTFGTFTGTWRTKRPIVDFDKCTDCMICWVFCPDDCFEVGQGELQAVDYNHCKGCGICAEACPAKCIEMIPEPEPTAEG